MKFATVLNFATLFTRASAFAPVSITNSISTSLNAETESNEETKSAPPAPAKKAAAKKAKPPKRGIGPAATFTMANKGELVAIAQSQNDVVGYFDPLGLADKNFWNQGVESTIGFLRQAEIKHGRIAMAAFIGFWVQSNVQWPFAMTLEGTPFPSGDLSPEAQWDAIPEAAKWQIILFVGTLEILDECNCGDLEARPHYMKGGQPGKFPEFSRLPLNLYDPFNFNKKMNDEDKARRLNMEINNGRLAMIGIFGFLAADAVPGSVPGIDKFAIPYEGNIMVPFEGQFSFFPN